MVQGENGVEIVRSAMIRRTDLFTKVGGGHYALANWPQELKRSPAEQLIEAVTHTDTEDWTTTK
jgi:hypothetical protein